MAELLCLWERKSKTVWSGKACKIQGASAETDSTTCPSKNEKNNYAGSERYPYCREDV